MLDRVIAWQRQRQEKQRQRQRRSPLCNVGPSDNLDRSWVEAGTPSPSASRTASRISPEILSFMRGAQIFGKNMGFCTNQGWGPVFRNRNFQTSCSVLTSTFQLFSSCSPLRWWRPPPASPRRIRSGRSRLARQLKRNKLR